MFSIQSFPLMAIYQITAIIKPKDAHSTHEHITHVWCAGAWHTVETVIKAITDKTDSFYVSAGGATAWVEVVRPLFINKRPFIRTVSDYTGRDNLLSLPNYGK